MPTSKRVFVPGGAVHFLHHRRLVELAFRPAPKLPYFLRGVGFSRRHKRRRTSFSATC
jgi:hypothetical protein